MTQVEVFNKIKEMIVDALGVDEEKVTMEASFKEDLGADSLDAVELIMSVEEEFDVEVDEEFSQNLKVVSDIVNYIVDKTK